MSKHLRCLGFGITRASAEFPDCHLLPLRDTTEGATVPNPLPFATSPRKTQRPHRVDHVTLFEFMIRDTEKTLPDLRPMHHLFPWAWCLELGQHPYNHDRTAFTSKSKSNSQGNPRGQPWYHHITESPPADPVSRCLIQRHQEAPICLSHWGKSLLS